MNDITMNPNFTDILWIISISLLAIACIITLTILREIDKKLNDILNMFKH